MNKPVLRNAAYGDKTDRILTTLQIGAVASPLIAYALRRYLLPPADTIWLFGAIPAALLLFCLGRICQGFLAKRLKWEKPIPNKEKSWREYLKPSRTLPSLFLSLLIGALFFAIAYGIRQLNYALTVHETAVRVSGYVYEIVAAVCGMLIFFIGSLTWFCPDEILFSDDISPVITIAIPIGVMIVFLILFNVPFAAILLYAALYFVLMLVRKTRVSQYEKKLRRLKQSEEDENDKARWG